MSEVHSQPKNVPFSGFPLLAVAALLLTAGISLLIAHASPVQGDEYKLFITGLSPTFSRMLHNQCNWPVSLDPVVSHALNFAAVHLFGPGWSSVRIFPLAGFLLMQSCLFVFVRRISGTRAASLALLLPAVCGPARYSFLLRPYGLLLGWYALALVSWQSAARRRQGRALSLVTLAAAIALTMNTHFYGFLLLAPLALAELVRTLRLRRVDPPMLVAIATGFLGIIPFLKGVNDFRTHYYDASNLKLHLFTNAYYEMMVIQTVGTRTQKLLELFFVLLALAVAIWLVRRLRRGTLPLPAEEAAFLVALSLLPALGFALARTVTHTFEARYCIAAALGIYALIAIAAASLLRSRAFATVVFLLLFALLLGTGVQRIRGAHQSAAAMWGGLALPPAVQSAILASPDQRLYFTSINDFEMFTYYEPDPQLRARAVMLYSPALEMRGEHDDTESVLSRHLAHIMPVAVMPFEQMASAPGGHVIALVPTGPGSWARFALQNTDAMVTPAGSAFGDDIVVARFPY